MVKQSYNKGSWNNQSWNQQSWYKQNTNDSKSKGKGKKGQDKGKGKGDQSKGRKVANVESDAWAQEQPAATATGDQPEPELTALFTFKDTMAPKSERPEESEPRRGRSPRRANLQPKSKETVTRGALMMAQQALVSASGSNEELYGQMISQAEKAVKEAEDKGLAANQALLERQEALNKLKEEAAQKKKEVKEEMARVRAESRAASAPASASRRLKADLDAGVHPRAAKKKEKDRQRAASHRAATMASRTADWKRHEIATHGMDDPDKWDQNDKGDEPEPPKERNLEPKRHRGGHLRSDRRKEYEKKKPSRRSDSPAWVHDKHPKSEEESVASGQDYLTDLANRLDRLRNEPEVRQKLNQVLMDAYEAKYNEKIEVEPKEDEETEGFGDEEFKDRPKNDEKPHWETHPGEIMPFKVLHGSSKTVSKKGHPYVKCQSCGKALNSMSLGSFWQHVDKKKCYPVEALEFWKEEHKKMKVEREESKKAPMGDDEAVSEKKRQQIAKADEAKKRTEYFDAHYERFRYKPESSAKDPPADKETTETKDEPEAKKEPEKKAEVKKIPKRPVETETSERERSPTRARSPARKSKDEGRAASALAESKKQRSLEKMW